MIDLNDFAGDIIYSALIHSIRSNSGIGFHNEQGHPAYLMGKDGHIDFHMWGDSPDHNRLFKMVCELSKQYGNSEISNWQQFCELAYNAYLEHTKNK